MVSAINTGYVALEQTYWGNIFILVLMVVLLGTVTVLPLTILAPKEPK